MTQQERQILAAAMDRILPSGPSPGAADANAIGYAEWVTRQPRFHRMSQSLTLGLTLLESVARGMWGKSFPACLEDERDAVLETVRRTPHPTVQRFFAMLVNVTLAGFLCAPDYGGNRGGLGWRYIGFKPHRLTRGSRALG